jgi:hypothetical protein
LVQLSKYNELCNKNRKAKNASELNSKSEHIPSTNEFGLTFLGGPLWHVL